MRGIYGYVSGLYYAGKPDLSAGVQCTGAPLLFAPGGLSISIAIESPGLPDESVKIREMSTCEMEGDLLQCRRAKREFAFYRPNPDGLLRTLRYAVHPDGQPMLCAPHDGLVDVAQCTILYDCASRMAGIETDDGVTLADLLAAPPFAP